MSKKSFVPAFTPRSLSYHITKQSSHLWHLSVKAPLSMVTHVKDHVTHMYRAYSIMPGVSCQHLPPSYTEEYFAHEIEHDTQQFVYQHFIEENIQNYLVEKKLAIVNWPRLCKVEGSLATGYTYTVALSLAPDFSLATWKNIPFSPPKRKNYTDLDCQVDSFVAALTPQPEAKEMATVAPGNWVRLTTQLNSPHLTTPLSSSSHHWIHIATPYVTTAFMELLVGKEQGATLTVPANTFLPLHTEESNTPYTFTVTIAAIVKTDSLTAESIQSTLNTTSRDELHDKLIEIFSYRNDISLRKSIIEELFYVLFNTYRFDIAPHAITRRKELLLHIMQSSPDSNVYTKQKQFESHITLLAETKLKEEALIDALAQLENVETTAQDIADYLSLCSNERLKEFVYFSPPDEEVIASDQPCAEHLIAQTVRREKTLNMVLRQLSQAAL